jgi:imidazoleglycerol-phosphate dehydratase
MTRIRRETGETRITIEITKDVGSTRVDTGVRFLDHMLVTFGHYAGLGLIVSASGDLRHHVIEDVAITLGAALAAYVPASCQRYGDRTVPMDDALVQCAVDLGGRIWYQGPLPSTMYDHFMRSLVENARATVHLRVLRGGNRHHVIEAAFKALGLALREALKIGDSVFSTKGPIHMEES